MIKIAILDDYQDVFQQIVEIEKYKKKFDFHIFKEPLITDKTGEDIIFCLKAKAAGVKVLGYFPNILESDGSDWLAHRGGEVSSTLATDNVLKIKKIRSLLIQKYKK